MSDVTVIAARRSVATRLQAILRDWAQLGLIDRVFVIDLDFERPGDVQIPVLVIDDFGVKAGVLQQELTRGVVDYVRVCALSVVDDLDGVVSAAQASRVIETAQASVPSAGHLRVQLFAGSPEGDWAGTLRPIIGWHNLVVSPEDAASPRVGSAPLPRDPDDPRWLFQLVGTCASLLGLWRGQSGGALDAQPPLPGPQLVPVRAYSRFLSAESVEQALDEKLVSVGVRYPVPRVDTATAVVVEDESEAAVRMADAVLAKHANAVLPRPRTSPPPVRRKDTNFFAALHMFFGFVWDALRNMPRRLADNLIRDAASILARHTERLVFGGADSGFSVVVKGVRADGSLASWSDFEAGLESVMQRTAPGSELGMPPQQPALWRDFVNAGMTLLDAGRRGADLPPFTHGTNAAIIATTERVASRQDGNYTLPPSLAAYFPGWRVEIADDIAAGRLQQRFDELKRTNPHIAHELASEQHRLTQWRSRATSSYVGRIGASLGAAFRQIVAEVEALNGRLAGLESASAGLEQVAGDQVALGKKIRWLTLGVLLAVVLFAVLTGVGLIAVVIGVVLMVASLVGWVITGTMMFLKSQGRLFAALHASEQAASDLDTAQRHLKEALEDMRRLSRAYRQYLDWARAFGAFVHAPLGRVTTEQVHPLVVGEGLPRAVRIGVAVPDRDSIDEVSNAWRPRLFEAGWLSGCWLEFLADVPAVLGDARYHIASNSEVLLQDTNLDGQGSILSRWSHAAADAAEARPISQRFLDKIDALMGEDGAARGRLLTKVSVVEGETGTVSTTTRADFLAGFEDGDQTAHQTFLDAIFAPHVTQGRIVQRTSLVHESRGLTHASVLVQFGSGTETTDYSGAGASRAGAPSEQGNDSAVPDIGDLWV